MIAVKKHHFKDHLTNYAFFNDKVTSVFHLEKPIEGFLDFSKVFSTVSHRILDKTSNIRLDNNTVQWVNEWLMGTVQ